MQPIDAGLRKYFSKEDLNTIYDAGLDLPRIWDFIQRTEKVGGAVAKLTLATANWVRLFATDEDAQFLYNSGLCIRFYLASGVSHRIL